MSVNAGIGVAQLLRVESRGNMAMLFALLSPLILGVSGAAIDIGRFAFLQADLQEIADASAIIGARQYVITVEKVTPKSVAENAAETRLKAVGLDGASVEAHADPAELMVNVNLDFTYRPTFLTALVKSPMRISVTSRAQAMQGQNVCVIGLKDTGNYVLELSANGSITAPTCGVFSNSTAQKGISVQGAAVLESALTCSAGGYDGAMGGYTPTPVTDCPAINDPLADRAPPTPTAACDHVNLVEIAGNQNQTLSPGVYCGGLTITGNATVTFQPGDYMINGGDVEFKGSATIVGDDVSFYFFGANPKMTIGGSATVEMSARRAGPMTGVLLWWDPDATGNNILVIESPNVNKLVGVVYLPSGRFQANVSGGAGEIAEESAFTAIIAQRIDIKGTSHLVLNTDYLATDVPVPEGVAGVGGQVVLRE